MKNHDDIQILARDIEELSSRRSDVVVKTLAPHVWTLEPKGWTGAEVSGKDVPVTFMAITHGDETCGVNVLAEVVRLIAEGTLVLPCRLGLALGNPEAAMRGRRFVERDLNRSFGGPRETVDGQRALEVEKLLVRSRVLVDLHQTITASETPFFIFKYASDTARFATRVAPDLPIVTYWEDQFSATGRTSVNFMLDKGGFGLTLEMGRLGYDPYQCALGVAVVLRALQVASRWDQLRAMPRSESTKSAAAYTMQAVIKAEDAASRLDPGHFNFKRVEAGARLGESGSGPILAPAAGWLLFPKYDASPGQELCRILRQVRAEELT